MKIEQSSIIRIFPWLSGLATALFYWTTRCRGFDPVISAQTVADHMGLTPFAPLTHPVWQLLIRTLDHIPIDFVSLLNSISACFMGFSVGVITFFMLQWNWNFLPEKYRQTSSASSASLISATTSTLILVGCIPCWLAGTRAMPISFDVALLCAALLLLWSMYHRPTCCKLALLALIWGIGITEYSTFIVFSPLVGMLLAIIIWRSRLFHWHCILIAVLLLLIGLSIYLLAAYTYTQTPAYTWRTFSGFHEVIWYIWRDEYHLMKASLGSVGWLLVFLVTIIPWLVVTLLPLSHRHSIKFHWHTHILHIVLLLIALAILFNLPIAPWSLSRTNPLLIVPYLFLATWTGRLIGTCYMIFASPDRYSRSLPILKRGARLLLLPLCLVVLLTSLWRNYPVIDSAPVRTISRLADLTINNLDGRSILISNGFIDNNLLLSAHQHKTTVHLINLSMGFSRSYRRYVGSLFDDIRLKNLANIGWTPLLEEWSKRPSITKTLAIMQPPDLWARMNRTPVPSPLPYLGFDDNYLPSVTTLQASATCWEQFIQQNLQDTSHYTDSISYPWLRAAKTLVSQFNNNLGILLEDAGDPKTANRAYQSALVADTNNLSAVMNRLVLLKRASDPQADTVQQQFDTMIQDDRQRLSLWQLASHYGYIRDPNAYIAMGHAWAVSGKTSAAIREIRKAISLSEETPALKLLLGSLYAETDQLASGQQIFEEILQDDPENSRAIAGLIRLAIAQNNFPLAHDYLKQLQAQDADISSDAFEQVAVMLAIQNNDYLQTSALLRKLLKSNPDNYRAWATLGLLANENNDRQTVSDVRKKLLDAVRKNPIHSIVLAQMEIADGNLAAAQNYLQNAVQYFPNKQMLHEQLLKLLVDLRLRQEAEQEATALLALDPNNALANYVIGTLQNSRGETLLAENSFRTSLAASRDPRTLNDLAWLLACKTDYSEALQLIEDSLRRVPDNPSAIDTYGFILFKMNRLDEAEMQIRKALQASPNHPDMQLHLALILEKQGHLQQSLQLAESLLNRMAEMPPTTYDDARELVYRLRNK